MDTSPTRKFMKNFLGFTKTSDIELPAERKKDSRLEEPSTMDSIKEGYKLFKSLGNLGKKKSGITNAS